MSKSVRRGPLNAYAVPCTDLARVPWKLMRGAGGGDRWDKTR